MAVVKLKSQAEVNQLVSLLDSYGIVLDPAYAYVDAKPTLKVGQWVIVWCGFREYAISWNQEDTGRSDVDFHVGSVNEIADELRMCS